MLLKLKVNDVLLEPIRVGDRLEFRFNAPEDLEYVTIEKDDFIGDLELSDIQLEQSTLSTSFVEPMESETVASGVFKSVQGISYEITDPNSDTWASIKQTVDGSITTYHNGTLQSTMAHTIEDIIFGISDIAGGDSSSFNLRLGGIQQSVKDQMFSSVQTQLAGFVGIQLEDIEGNYNTILNTVNAHSQTIGTSGGNLAQMVMNDSLFKVDVIDEINDAKSSVNVLSDSIGLRSSGNTIYIGGEGILIDAESIYLGSSTQIGDGVITNRMIASNAQIDAAKITNLTVSNAQIVSLDVSKLSGNKSNFVQSNWNDINNYVQINANGIEMMGNYTWRRNIMNATGIELYNGQGGYSLAGTIGYFKRTISEATSDESVMDTGFGGHTIGIAANPTHHVAIGYNSSDYNNRNYKSAIRVDGSNGNISFDKQMFITGTSTHLHFGGNQIRQVSQVRMIGPNQGSDSVTGIFSDGGTDRLWVQGWGGVRIGDRRPSDGSYQNHLQVTRSGISAYVPLNMNGNEITNQSDIRLKSNIENSSLDALREIERLEFVEFDWDMEKPTNEGKPNERQFGIIAQYSPFLQTKAGDSESYLSVDLTKQINLNSKATQELLNYTRKLEERIEVLEGGK